MHEWFRQLVRAYMAEKGTSEEDIRASMPPQAWDSFREVMTKEPTGDVMLFPQVVHGLGDLWSLDEAEREDLLVAYVGCWDREKYHSYIEGKSA